MFLNIALGFAKLWPTRVKLNLKVFQQCNPSHDIVSNRLVVICCVHKCRVNKFFFARSTARHSAAVNHNSDEFESRSIRKQITKYTKIHRTRERASI